VVKSAVVYGSSLHEAYKNPVEEYFPIVVAAMLRATYVRSSGEKVLERFINNETWLRELRNKVFSVPFVAIWQTIKQVFNSFFETSLGEEVLRAITLRGAVKAWGSLFFSSERHEVELTTLSAVRWLDMRMEHTLSSFLTIPELRYSGRVYPGFEISEVLVEDLEEMTDEELTAIMSSDELSFIEETKQEEEVHRTMSDGDKVRFVNKAIAEAKQLNQYAIDDVESTAVKVGMKAFPRPGVIDKTTIDRTWSDNTAKVQELVAFRVVNTAVVDIHPPGANLDYMYYLPERTPGDFRTWEPGERLKDSKLPDGNYFSWEGVRVYTARMIAPIYDIEKITEISLDIIQYTGVAGAGKTTALGKNMRVNSVVLATSRAGRDELLDVAKRQSPERGLVIDEKQIRTKDSYAMMKPERRFKTDHSQLDEVFMDHPGFVWAVLYALHGSNGKLSGTSEQYGDEIQITYINRTNMLTSYHQYPEGFFDNVKFFSDSYRMPCDVAVVHSDLYGRKFLDPIHTYNQVERSFGAKQISSISDVPLDVDAQYITMTRLEKKDLANYLRSQGVRVAKGRGDKGTKVNTPAEVQGQTAEIVHLVRASLHNKQAYDANRTDQILVATTRHTHRCMYWHVSTIEQGDGLLAKVTQSVTADQISSVKKLPGDKVVHSSGLCKKCDKIWP